MSHREDQAKTIPAKNIVTGTSAAVFVSVLLLLLPLLQ
jgi:hypothetical protein